MGVLSWLLSGAAAFTVTRFVPLLRRKKRLFELVTAIILALLGGIGATMMDFGGWREADPRAILFAFLCSLAGCGALRLFAGVFTRPQKHSPAVDLTQSAR